MFSWSSNVLSEPSPKRIYGVYYYVYTGQPARVRMIGIYDSLDLAKKRLLNVLGEYKQNGSNPHCVRSTHMTNGVKHERIGWINEFIVNEDIPDTGLSCDQPQSAINLFE